MPTLTGPSASSRAVPSIPANRPSITSTWKFNARCPTRGLRGIYKELSARRLAADARPVRRWGLLLRLARAPCETRWQTAKKAPRRETGGTTAGFDFNTSEYVEFAIDRRTRLHKKLAPRRSQAAFPTRRSSNANSLRGQNSVRFSEICTSFQRDILRRHF
jgi:hypothetical protein